MKLVWPWKTLSHDTKIIVPSMHEYHMIQRYIEIWIDWQCHRMMDF
jgi:hypothetical protein